jgi:MoaA/NifB/PqqE/SkfB family radical SAM enzyme
MRVFSRPPRAGRLRLLVMAVADRCDQQCLHCDIWRPGPRAAALTLDERLAVVEDALRAGVREVFLTGGEPLLSADLWPIARRLKEARVKRTLATNGMRLAVHAREVAAFFDEVYVSLDGATPTTHDLCRGARSAFARLCAGIDAVRSQEPRPRLVARSVLHGRNLADFEAMPEAARRLGFDRVSFLALDASSPAFGADPLSRRGLVPSAAQVDAFEGAIDRLEGQGELGNFVLEPAEKLRGLARRLRASEDATGPRPDCDVAIWSSVVEADGRVRPCFFHAPVGDVRHGLLAVRESTAYADGLGRIAGWNETCARCVCPKRRATGLWHRLTA